jgi:hypothetical protein
MNLDAYVNLSYLHVISLYLGHEKWKNWYDHEQMCKFLDVKPKSNWGVE